MAHEVIWTAAALDHLAELFDYLAESIAARDALAYCDAFFPATARLADFPRMCAETPEYGEGVRRLTRPDGRLVLYEVDDNAQVVRILAVVGLRQLPKKIK
ncbi:MAG: type II toxin-antitoxin system RelE/ParE family toxin [Acidobacteriaceae bacterium]|jgi:plasmid stabilization system protein ParE|nr:type II toxin-antitoxin system RelE/ParE family toxin [Acidobacteriaceae bacterium]